jgi:hypothetical protein
MNSRRLKIVFIKLMLICLLLVSGCIQENTITKKLTSDEYVLIHFAKMTKGDLLEGNFDYSNEFPLSFYDGPFIRINNDSKTIQGLGQYNTSANFTGILIYSTADLTPVAHGAGSNYLVVYQLPSAYEDVKIQNIDENGIVTIVYNNSTIILKPGEQWFNSTNKIESGNLANYTYKVNLTINETIINYGIWNKSGINSR